MDSIELLLKNFVDCDSDVGVKGIWLFEAIARVEKQRILLEEWNIGTEEWNRYHE